VRPAASLLALVPAGGLIAGLLLSAPAGSLAQGLGGNLRQGDEPLEINADEGIEWRRDEQKYIARGNARAARGDIEVFADILTAHYRPGETGDTEIYQVDAQGNVRIVTPSERVYGDLARYDVDRGLMILWGEDLRLETEADTLTAEDSLEYWEERQIAVARGNATATREDRQLRADLMTAYFKENAEGDLDIDYVNATGNVEISTAAEFARGDKAVYYVQQQLATLEGAVKITRGENQLNGGYAEVNLETGISKLLGAPPGAGGDTRVRGLLVPRRKPDGAGDS